MNPLMLLYCLVVTFVSLTLILAYTKFHRFKRKIALHEDHFSRLIEIAKQSLKTLDVPIGAILLYKDKIIGEGYNTVLRNAKAGEHAEINAISDAMNKIGIETFFLLERDSLVLVSTFEPCVMCLGSFINYNIQHVYFLKEKGFLYTGKEQALFLRYLFRRKQVKHCNEQDSLFEEHPGYLHKIIGIPIEK
jgi:tRNA(Arg) A34 adenosine deaminase TadA